MSSREEAWDACQGILLLGDAGDIARAAFDGAWEVATAAERERIRKAATPWLRLDGHYLLIPADLLLGDAP